MAYRRVGQFCRGRVYRERKLGHVCALLAGAAVGGRGPGPGARVASDLPAPQRGKANRT